MDNITVLDHGYVRLLRIDGSDLDVQNAAHTSFNKEVAKVKPEFIERLAKERHMSPFRHVGLWLEIKLPGDVRGQFLKHIVGNCVVEEGTAWNEESFRGAHEKLSFNIPEPRHPKGKWGQGDKIEKQLSNEFQSELKYACERAEYNYKRWLERGVAPENARKFLLFYATYTTIRCRMSLEAAFHFWELRQTDHAQLEIKEYSKAIDIICGKHFPISWKALKASIVI